MRPLVPLVRARPTNGSDTPASVARREVPRQRRSAFAVLTVLAALFFGAIPDLATAQGVTLKVMVEGIERTALVYPGKEATITASPLVLAFHPAGGDSERFAFPGRTLPHMVWPEATVVYPEGLSHPDLVLQRRV
jgi:hypothetical protein